MIKFLIQKDFFFNCTQHAIIFRIKKFLAFISKKNIPNILLTLRPSECFGLGLRLGLGLGAGLGPWCTACWCWWCCLWLLPADFFSWCLSECRRAVILTGRDGPWLWSQQHPTWLGDWGFKHLAAACDSETRLPTRLLLSSRLLLALVIIYYKLITVVPYSRVSREIK